MPRKGERSTGAEGLRPFGVNLMVQECSIPKFSAAEIRPSLGFEVGGGQSWLAAPRSSAGWTLAKFLIEEAVGSPVVGTFTERFAWRSLVRNSTQSPALQTIENAVIVSWVLNWRSSQVPEKGG